MVVSRPQLTGYWERPMEQVIVTEIVRQDPCFHVERWLLVAMA